MRLLARMCLVTFPALHQEPSRVVPQTQEAAWRPRISVEGFPESVGRSIQAALERVEQAPEDPAAAGELGAVLYGNQLHSAAAACFARAAALDREPQRWLYYCGLSYQKAQRIPDAIAAFERAARADAEYSPLLLALSALLVESDPSRAEQLSRRAVELDGTQAVAHASLGRLAAIQGHDEEALVHLRRAVELEPAFGAVHYELAMLLRSAGKAEEANEHLRLFEVGGSVPTLKDPWREALDRMARSPITVKNTAILLWQAGRNDEARSLLEAVVQEHPEHEGLRDLLGETYARLRLHEQAVEQFRLVLKSSPNNIEVKSKLALALANLGRAEEAEAVLRAALEQRPDSGLVLQQLAQVIAGQGRREEALALFRRAVAAQPGDEGIRLEFARSLARFGAGKEALEQAHIALDIAPRSVRARLLLGSLLKGAGDFTGADEQLEAALATDPLLWQAYVELSDSALQSGAPERARKQLERGLQHLPGSSALMSGLAWLLATSPDNAQRDGPRAVELAKKACEAEPGAPESLDVLAAAYAEVGRFEDAIQTERRAIQAAIQAERRYLAKDYRQRLSVYTKGHPHREAVR